MNRTLIVLIAGLGLLTSSNDAAAPCPAGVTATPYGGSCPFFGQDSKLNATYTPASCVLRLELTASQTCCNTYPSQQFLLIGFTKIDPGIVLPELLPGCLLRVLPAVLLVQPAKPVGVWEIPLPAVPSLLTVYMQGVNDYFTTIGFTHDYQSSNGLKIDIL